MKTSTIGCSSDVIQNKIKTEEKALRSWYGGTDVRKVVQLYELCQSSAGQ